MNTTKAHRHVKFQATNRRRGAILFFTAFLMIFFIMLVAFTIDVGYMFVVRSEAKRATDAAALAGASELINGVGSARVEAFEFLNRNTIGSKNCAGDDDWMNQLQSTGVHYIDTKDKISIETGHWDYDADSPSVGENDNRFSASTKLPAAVRVKAVQTGIPSLFGSLILESGCFSVEAESVAGYQPRDIVIVLDFSGSMNDDSELKRITSTDDPDRGPVENNLMEIWEDLGTPNYGKLTFEPQYVTMTKHDHGAPEVSVTLKGDRVSINSRQDVDEVKVTYNTGARETFRSNHHTRIGRAGDFPPIAHAANAFIRTVQVKSGGRTQTFSFTEGEIANLLGLNIPYPYPGGRSWNDYIKYVQTSSSVRNAGYKNKFGGMTLVNYWLEKYPSSTQVPDLWKVRAQPIQAVKDAVDVFIDYIGDVDSSDRVGLVVYNSRDQHATLEHSLSKDFDVVTDTVHHRQAGHYNSMTNIGAGIQVARKQLDENGRSGAFKMIVLMTDGQANTSSQSGLNGPQYALSEARKAADSGYPIMTISLGNGADKNLMQKIADTTEEGVHFNVPGMGSGVTDYESGLLDTFRKIADDHPLLLVK
ncbi:MAG: VWA domain-containing protein [Planctomycetia bacterium]|jgi:hypothetical protein